MGLLKDIIERKENFGEIEKGAGGSVIWKTNPSLTAYLKDSEVDNQDVAFIVTKTVKYFRRALGISLSTIEKFHVKKITEDTIRRFKNVFSDFPKGSLELSEQDFTCRIWQPYLSGESLLPGSLWLEVVQRMMFEIYSTPIEISVPAGSRIPPCELYYLARVQHKLNNPFTEEDYQK